jgi:hypothetical protein
MYKHLTEYEWSILRGISERIDDDSADPDELAEIIKVLNRERNRIISENFRKEINGQ